jgi:CxxC motif-containing protein
LEDSGLEYERGERKKVVCIVCPMGCVIDAVCEEKDGEVEIKRISGLGCNRGRTYAELEITKPMRTLTTTMRVVGGKKKLVSVKTSKPVPKSMIFECMEEINRSEAKAPIFVGQVLIKNIKGTGADVVATYEVEAWE